MKNKCHTGWKTLWEKEKLLVTSNFSFSHIVFHRYISSMRQKTVLCGNNYSDGLNATWQALVTSNFSFSHNVFHSYISLVHQNVVLCGYWLNSTWQTHVTCNFSFSHNVFHSYISLVCQNVVLCGNGLTSHQSETVNNFNSLSNDKLLDWSKLKSLMDNKINVTEKSKFVFGQVENIMGKGENAGYQHFLLFAQCFQSLQFQGVRSQVGVVKS